MTDKPLTKNIIGFDGHTDLARYESLGGYAAVRKTIGRTDPDAVLELLKDANLRGRGGAGIPTGMKGGFLSKKEGNGHSYPGAKADEMETGTF